MSAPQRDGNIPVGALVIVPLDGFPVPVAQALAADLAALGATARIDVPVPLPDSTYDPGRGQYRAELLLALLSGHGAPHVLGLTQHDLYTGNLNFVFGIASAGGACLVSTARLMAGADDALFRGRLLKEAVHELGHTAGLQHCGDARCVMYFSNSLADTDRKRSTYCERCTERLAAMQRRQKAGRAGR